VVYGNIKTKNISSKQWSQIAKGGVSESSPKVAQRQNQILVRNGCQT